MRRYRRKNQQEQTISLVLWVILLIVLMPVAGLYLMSSEDAKAKPWGGVLFALGALLWFVVLGLL